MSASRLVWPALAAVVLMACGGGSSSDSPAVTQPPVSPPPAVPAPDPAAPQLTLTRTGSGSVSSAPAGIACGTTCSATFAQNAAVTLTATAASGYTFGGWTGGGCTGTSTCTVTMSAATTVAASFTPTPVSGTRYVPLTLVEGPVAANVPVRTGIPFPPGAVASASRLRLETGNGSGEVPAQFDTLVNWPDGSVKVALAHVVTDLGAAGSYRVAYGTDVSRAALPRDVAVTGTPATEVTVDTGRVRFAINNKGLMHRLWRDANGDGSFATSEQVLNGADLYMVNAHDNLEYTASAASDAIVTVEENGPLRAVIKVRGSLRHTTGGTLVKYLVRYYAHQGSDKVDIDVSVIDDRLEANTAAFPYPTRLALAAKGLGMRWTYVSDSAASYRFGGESGMAYGGTVSGEHRLTQTGQFTFDNGGDLGHTFAYAGVGSGTRAPGWVALDSGSRHLTLMVKDFWQQFPSELNVNGNTLTAALFPERSVGATADTSLPTQSGTLYRRPNTFYFNREGGAKTYQLRFAFDNATPTTPVLHALNDSFQRHRLELMATPAWYVASGVFGDLSVGGSSTTVGYDASMLRDIYEPSLERNGGAQATMYGWRDFGDRLRAGWATVVNDVRIPSFYNDTHVGANNFFSQFLRTGEQRWFQLGDVATRHFMDIDVSHGPRQGYWNTGGQPQPAGEVKAGSHENVDHDARNLHWGHAHVSGLSDLYLLTGDKRAFEVLGEIANWWKFVTPHFYKLPFATSGTGYTYREAERDYAWPLYVMNEWVRVTGDASYHRDTAGQLARYLVQWWQTPLNHIGYNPATDVTSNTVLGVNNAANGTGYWTMSRMDNYNTANLATGTNPWMAGPLLGNVIKFYEQDQQFAAAGQASGVSHPHLKDMLFQCMNYVVKYGYHPTSNYFVYSETTRGTNGGDTHILYGLAYLDRLYKQELAAGRIANPQWYDTQANWLPIATRGYDRLNTMRVGAYTQAYGFYGYELVYPADFFKVMQDTLGR